MTSFQRQRAIRNIELSSWSAVHAAQHRNSVGRNPSPRCFMLWLRSCIRRRGRGPTMGNDVVRPGPGTVAVHPAPGEGSDHRTCCCAASASGKVAVHPTPGEGSVHRKSCCASGAPLCIRRRGECFCASGAGGAVRPREMLLCNRRLGTCCCASDARERARPRQLTTVTHSCTPVAHI